VARALAADPPVLLMDEPFSAVDPVVRSSLQDELIRLQAGLRKTVVLVTHDVEEAIKVGDLVAVCRPGGHLAQVDTPKRLLAFPADDYVEGFIGFDRGIRRLSFFPADGLDLGLEAVLGEQATVAEALQVAKSAGHHLSSIVQLKPLAASMVFGAPPEFKTRADGQAGLRERYGVAFKGFDALDESGPITLKALMDGQVQAADVFTTTPQILTDHLVSLADPKSDFAAQNVVPLVYRKGANATIVNTLNAISARLTTAGLLEMDKAIVVDHANYSTVATAWLKAEGLPS
jgi:hypothetical protein